MIAAGLAIDRAGAATAKFRGREAALQTRVRPGLLMYFHRPLADPKPMLTRRTSRLCPSASMPCPASHSPRWFALCTLLLLALLPALPALAAGIAETQLQRFAGQVDSLSGRFVQRVYNADGEISDESSGTLALSKPNLFRWDYLDPSPQRIVADGFHVWIYDEELEQASVRPQAEDEQQSPLAVLLDLSKLNQSFTLNEGGRRAGADWLQLKPRQNDEAVAQVDLGFDRDRLTRMHMIDQLGQRTEIEFSDWQRNPDLGADHFRFDPPDGVDVVGEFDNRPRVDKLDPDA